MMYRILNILLWPLWFFYTLRVAWRGRTGITTRERSLEKSTGLRILDFYFDATGRNTKDIFDYWKPIEGSQLDMEWLLEVDNHEEKHNTIIALEWLKFDTGLKEMFFTERTLMRTKW